MHQFQTSQYQASPGIVRAAYQSHENMPGRFLANFWIVAPVSEIASPIAATEKILGIVGGSQEERG
jgi:hypothetical protein